MTVVLDAYAVLAVLRGEPGGKAVIELLADSSERAVINSVNLAEVVDQLMRRFELSRARVDDALGPILEESIEIVSADAGLAFRAGEMRKKYYQRSSRQLSMADCFVLATATEHDTIVTADQDIVKSAQREGIKVLVVS